MASLAAGIVTRGQLARSGKHNYLAVSPQPANQKVGSSNLSGRTIHPIEMPRHRTEMHGSSAR